VTEQPSRFHASPAQIDAFLREHFAEDALLNYYRAVGDEILDEALSHGREHRGVMESRNAKHVYLAGMADVMEAIWDFRYYPAKLPALKTYDRPFNKPRENRAVPETFDALLEASSPPGARELEEAHPVPKDARQKMREALLRLHPEDSTYHPTNTRLPSPKLPIDVRIRSIPGGFVALQDDDPKRTVAAANSLPVLMSKLQDVSGTVNVMDPNQEIQPLAPVPAEMQAVQNTPAGETPQPCYRTKTHEPHKWLKGRKAVQCPGTVES
jgi:hypothetical protein